MRFHGSAATTAHDGRIFARHADVAHRPPVDHDDHLAGRDRRETARRDGPRAVVEARDVDAVGKSDGIGQRVTPVATGSGRRVASVTSICINCSIDNRSRSCGDGSDAASVGARTTMMAKVVTACRSAVGAL
jgi:hypothetical protein